MFVWKIRLKGTNLFYQPVRGSWNKSKTNLGEHGKVYSRRRPTLEDIRGMIYVSETLANKHNIPIVRVPSRPGAWKFAGKPEFEIVTYLCRECREVTKPHE